MEHGTGGTATDGGWAHEHRYDVLLATPAVHEAVRRNAARARRPMSAQEFLSRAASLTPLVGAPMLGGAERGRRLGLALRLRTGRTREAELPVPVGRVLAAVLCSLALRAQEVRAVAQHEDGCTLTADIPSDARTFGGVLEVCVTRAAPGTTSVRAKAEIPGQLIDWGTSRRTLDTLLADLNAPDLG
ncbi:MULTISPECIES: hypothetical protein [Streptomyces]|jgi:hypothetical protein|uniref:Uncharacterized protein n=2 Tax=Streptomyces TaxID=1883 RepID=A0AA40SK17_9ACTN|nr:MULTISPECIES: hypothetical protein [Streptomyces]MBA8947575.1 hypothetical protein [Streptomyces calvus]MBA8973945.1 hypothetical protein [Streptomyces calvus]MYS31756.1 hypothetical protein [Streptomyces sp. SID7804]